MSRALALALAACALTPAVASAADQPLIPRAEQGAVMLSLTPAGVDAPVQVSPGQVAWTYAVRPAKAVRLVDPLPKRIRPSGKALPAGEPLFHYRLAGGASAYCPSMPRGLGTAQCLRDLDDDGKFDFCYVGETRGIKSRFFVVLVNNLSRCEGQYRFEPTTWEASAPGAMVFTGFKDGVATFHPRIEDHTVETEKRCTPTDDGACTVMGVRIRVERAGEAARITFLGAEEAGIETYMGGGLGMRRLIYKKSK